MVANLEATIEDLYAVPGKAEIVNGEIVIMSPTGAAPNYAASEIFVSLREYARQTRTGHAVADNAAFVVNLSNRKSFSPDAAFYSGTWPGMKFFDGAPDFAVEVRSEGDYGPTAEAAIAKKRDDYFAARTLAVCSFPSPGKDHHIQRTIRRPQSFSAAAKWPMLKPLCLDGRCRWTISLSNRQGNIIS